MNIRFSSEFPEQLIVDAILTLANNVSQIFNFSDGSSYGSLAIFRDRVELSVSEKLTYNLDTTGIHTYRLTGINKDINLYIDGQLAINGTGKFTNQAKSKILEFGDLS